MTTIGHREVSRMGMGVFPLTLDGRPGFAAAVELIRLALDHGVRLIDTADSYHLPGEPAGYGEDIVKAALADWEGDASAVLIATKGSRLLTPEGERVSNGSPEYLRRACRSSAHRLGVERIDLYQLHRPDPQVPYVESLSVLAELRHAGVIDMIGISNADTDQILLARDVLGDGLVSVQNQFGPNHTSTLPELELCGELGLAFIPWGTFWPADDGLPLHEKFASIAEVALERGISAHRVVLAWVMSLGDHVVPIPGARRTDSLLDSLQARSDHLSSREKQLLDMELLGTERGMPQHCGHRSTTSTK